MEDLGLESHRHLKRSVLESGGRQVVPAFWFILAMSSTARVSVPGRGLAGRSHIMGSRHRKDGSTLVQEKEDELFLRPDKSIRSIEHRKVRHQVGTELHTVDDPDAAVFTRPKFDHPPRIAKKSSRGLRHWKTKAWKRRSAERHRRNEERRLLLTDLE